MILFLASIALAAFAVWVLAGAIMDTFYNKH